MKVANMPLDLELIKSMIEEEEEIVEQPLNQEMVKEIALVVEEALFKAPPTLFLNLTPQQRIRKFSSEVKKVILESFSQATRSEAEKSREQSRKKDVLRTIETKEIEKDELRREMFKKQILSVALAMQGAIISGSTSRGLFMEKILMDNTYPIDKA